MGIYSQMERLKIEGEADIFQYIKAVRIQRAGLILDVVRTALGPYHQCALPHAVILPQDQYIFCHRMLIDYLETFDGYANFQQ